MSDDKILDYFPEEHGPYEGEMIIIKSFYFETPAHLYAARLKEAGIPSFVSNSSINIPFGNGSITLHIRKEDQEKAAHIIRQMDKRDLVKEDSDEESFHDADHDDIAYQRAIHEKKDNKYWIIVLIIVLLLVAIFARYAFSINSLRDWWQ